MQTQLMAHLGTIKRKTQSVHKPKVDTNILSTTIKKNRRQNKKCNAKTRQKKNVNHALLAKSVERVETHFKDDKNQAGRQAGRRHKMTTISMKIRECRGERVQGGAEK